MARVPEPARPSKWRRVQWPSLTGPELFTDGERLYFSIRTSNQEETGLWASDGTASGTRRVSDRAVCPNYPTRTRSSKWAASGRLLFYASYPDCELVVSDGTAGGRGSCEPPTAMCSTESKSCSPSETISSSTQAMKSGRRTEPMPAPRDPGAFHPAK